MFLVAAAHADSRDPIDPAAEIPDESTMSEEIDLGVSVIDEIIAVEQKNVTLLRTELTKADDRLFSLYNTLNSDDSLDMICKKETRIGSQIKYRVCKSSYHRQIESESGSDFLDGDSVSTSSRAPAGHYGKVRSNMASLMAEHPELQRALNERAILRRRIAELKGNE